MPCPTKKDSRNRSIRILALYLEMMLDDSFYEFQITKKPSISKFAIVEPEGIDEQRDGSNDCGVWVASWMLECILSDSYKIQVNDATRMWIAINLVINPYNTMKDEVVKLAFENLKEL